MNVPPFLKSDFDMGKLGLADGWLVHSPGKRRRDYHLGKTGLLSRCQLNLNQPDHLRRTEYKVPASASSQRQTFELKFIDEISEKEISFTWVIWGTS